MRGKSPLRPEFTGALFIMAKVSEEHYLGYILNSDEAIEGFLDAFGLTPAETNRPIQNSMVRAETREKLEIDRFIDTLHREFPSSSLMSDAARLIQDTVYGNRLMTRTDPDTILLRWTDQEYTLFRSVEQAVYGDVVTGGFQTVDDFVLMANKVLNRRKSRAGRSLEHHLSAIFDDNHIRYTAQAVTEGNKKPDFLFPSEKEYHDVTFAVEKLCTLAAKTTCKDRWRQILNEADRLRDENKYLCTMQQGISSAQLREMESERVILVVPKAYHSAYPKEKREQLWTLDRFIGYVKEMEGLI